MTKLLIVEDSQVDRSILMAIFKQHLPYCQLFFATDAYEAREIIAFESPQVVLLDLNLPRMSGELFLKHLMHNYPLPVIVISRVDENSTNAERRVKALGAIELLTKPTSRRDIARFAKQLCQSLCDLIGVCPVQSYQTEALARTSPILSDGGSIESNSGIKPSIIAIGASTGGPHALEEILKHLDKDCPPVLIAQHFSLQYIEEFADRLNRITQANVLIPKNGQCIESGTIYLAPPEKQMRAVQNGLLLIEDTDETQQYAPSVDVLFNSLVKVQPKNTVAILLTGMGDDGASGMLKLRRAGATTIAQNETSSVIFGMPKRAIELGAAQHVLHLSAIGPVLKRWAAATASTRPLESTTRLSTLLTLGT